MKISAADHQRVSQAIAAAEGNTAGEILAMTADRSDSYHDVALHYAVAVMFLAIAWFVAFPGQLEWWWARLFGWTAPDQQQLLLLLLGIALLKFLAVLLIMRWKPLRLALTPGSTKSRRVRRRAIMLFKAAAERRTVGRTGVLIYLSMGERRAEIVGDEAITAATTPETWGEAMADLVAETKEGRPTDGIVAAIARIGTVLAEHFPRDPADKNEIPDKLIEL